MTEKFRLVKVSTCIIAAVLVIAVWLYVICNIAKFNFALIIAGCMFITFLMAYVVFMLGIIAFEQAKPVA